MKPQLNKAKGYYQFFVCDKNLEKPKHFYQHRFVFESIKGAIPEGFVIDHCNNCKTDSRIKHLQLLSPAENVQKSCNKSITYINVETKEEKSYISAIKTAAIFCHW